MTPEEEVEVVAALAKVARPVILENFSKRSCIASTRIGLDVLQYFGVRAVPVPLFVLLMNDEAVKLIEAGYDQAQLQAELGKRTPQEEGGPWSIGLGAEIENSPDWAGHLVIGLPQMRAVLDLAFDQASRPHKEMEIPESGQLFPVPNDKWWTGEEDRESFAAISNSGGRIGIVLDRKAKDPDGYKRSDNWRRRSTRNPGTRQAFADTTGKIIRLVKDELARESEQRAASSPPENLEPM